MLNIFFIYLVAYIGKIGRRGLTGSERLPSTKLAWYRYLHTSDAAEDGKQGQTSHNLSTSGTWQRRRMTLFKRCFGQTPVICCSRSRYNIFTCITLTSAVRTMMTGCPDLYLLLLWLAWIECLGFNQRIFWKTRFLWLPFHQNLIKIIGTALLGYGYGSHFLTNINTSDIFWGGA